MDQQRVGFCMSVMIRVLDIYALGNTHPYTHSYGRFLCGAYMYIYAPYFTPPSLFVWLTSMWRVSSRHFFFFSFFLSRMLSAVCPSWY